MGWISFPARLARRQLFQDVPKLIAAILGVMFACVLVFMQLGFRDSLNTSAASAPTKMKAEIFLVDKQSEALWRTVRFDRSILMRALAVPNVDRVYPMYLGLGKFKNVDTRIKRTLMIYGFDPEAHLLDVPEIDRQIPLLKIKDNVLFDRASRPEFGAVQQQITEGRNITEINDYKVKVVGTFLMGTSFSADGNLVTSDLNFSRIFPDRQMSQIDIGLIRVKDKTKIRETAVTLKSMLGQDVHVFTYQELIEYEQNYWKTMAPVGFIFGMGVVMGLFVGMIIVYQILFTEIGNNMTEYATLKAMGYSHGYLVRVVFSLAFLLAVMGFFPGFMVSKMLYDLAESKIFIPFPMPIEKVITVFCFILGMCMLSALFAIRKLKSINPADMF